MLDMSVIVHAPFYCTGISLIRDIHGRDIRVSLQAYNVYGVFQTAISANPKIEFEMPIANSESTFVKIVGYKYVHVWVYVKLFFPNHILWT